MGIDLCVRSLLRRTTQVDRLTPAIHTTLCMCTHLLHLHQRGRPTPTHLPARTMSTSAHTHVHARLARRCAPTKRQSRGNDRPPLVNEPIRPADRVASRPLPPEDRAFRVNFGGKFGDTFSGTIAENGACFGDAFDGVPVAMETGQRGHW